MRIEKKTKEREIFEVTEEVAIKMEDHIVILEKGDKFELLDKDEE